MRPGSPPNIPLLLVDSEMGPKENLRAVSSEVSAAHPPLSSHRAHKLVLTRPGKNTIYKKGTWLTRGSKPATGAAEHGSGRTTSAAKIQSPSVFSPRQHLPRASRTKLPV